MDGSITTAHVRRQLILARVTQPGNWKLEGAGGILGRGNDADICLDDKAISRHHCRFLATPHGWMIEDLAATNGTRLNGVPVLRAYLNSGDWLDVGETRFRVNVVEAPGCVLAEAMDALWPSQPVNRAPYRRAA